MILLQSDLTCYETHIEGTDDGGKSISITYPAIEAVSVSKK